MVEVERLVSRDHVAPLRSGEPRVIACQGVERRAMLSGRSCLLRAYRESDAPLLPGTIGTLDVVRYMSHRIPHPYTAEDAAAWVASASSTDPIDDYAIEVDGRFAGCAGIAAFHGESSGVAELGYWIVPEFWGRGIASDAARTLARYALRERGFRRLNAWVMAPNVASARVLERAGFTREGLVREHLTSRDGVVCDGIVYGRLATDPDPEPRENV